MSAVKSLSQRAKMFFLDKTIRKQIFNELLCMDWSKHDEWRLIAGNYYDI